MSNFSQFFPSGGGSGVGGGINSYASFDIGSELFDNNPPGYIISTGLYTNPVDSSVWLKTGKELLDTSNTYPNASFRTDNFVESGTGGNTSARGGLAIQNGTDFFWAIDYVGQGPYCRFLKVNKNTKAFGPGPNRDSTVPAGSNGAFCVAINTSTDEFIVHDYFSTTSSQLTIRSQVGGEPSNTVVSTINTSAIGRQVLFMTYDAANNYLYLLADNRNIYVWDLNTGAALAGFTPWSAATAGHTPTGITIHPTTGNIWTTQTSPVAVQPPLTYERNPATGAFLSTTPITMYPTTAGVNTGTTTGIVWDNSTTLYAFTSTSTIRLSEYTSTSTRYVGDPVGRTNSDTTKPLFIKLK